MLVVNIDATARDSKTRSQVACVLDERDDTPSRLAAAGADGRQEERCKARGREVLGEGGRREREP
eukprot:926414-Rhodomonas_salina.1